MIHKSAPLSIQVQLSTLEKQGSLLRYHAFPYSFFFSRSTRIRELANLK